MPHSTRPEVPRTSPPGSILGWDIGGVNTKGARVDASASGVIRTVSAPFEIQHSPAGLAPTLRRLAGELGGGAAAHAVTMTAELSQVFRTKREGVGFVLDAVEAAFPRAEIRVYTVGGGLVAPAAARERPLEAGASNWAATARLAGRFVPDCLVIDIGTTSTDIIPVVAGAVAAAGRTDPERLLSRELVYTGAVRTPAEAVAREVPLHGGQCPLAAEGFALVGDAHLWLGALAPDDFTAPTPDRRPATREFAGERLARAVCGDREMLDSAAVDAIARALVEAQVRTVVEALEVVHHRHPSIGRAVVAGLGDFIAAEAARRAGLAVEPLARWLGDAARTAPAAAVAWLLADEMAGATP